MQNINSYRKFERNKNEVKQNGEYVLYWMQINRRFHYNYALEYAVAWANKLDKTLLIYEGLNIDYPWASDRIHTFMMEGMKENLEFAQDHNLNYFSYVEPKSEAGKGLFYKLAENACCVISDEYPVFIIRKHNERVAERIDVPYTTIDSNGIIPLGITDKDPYSAYLFRKEMQKHFIEAFSNPPKKDPIKDLKNNSRVDLLDGFVDEYPSATNQFEDIQKTIAELEIDHSVPAVDVSGTRQAALGKLGHFVAHSLFDYDEKEITLMRRRQAG